MTTRVATETDLPQIISLSTRVQEHLTASGSRQETGPLPEDMVGKAIDEQWSFVLVDSSSDAVTGCAFVHPLTAEFFPTVDVQDFDEPRWFLHSVMLEPKFQGQGLGMRLLGDVFAALKDRGRGKGTVLTDCWAGNEKLRAFYERAGCGFVAMVPEKDYEIAVFAKKLSE